MLTTTPKRNPASKINRSDIDRLGAMGPAGLKTATLGSAV